jgi:hypothetical protein
MSARVFKFRPKAVLTSTRSACTKQTGTVISFPSPSLFRRTKGADKTQQPAQADFSRWREIGGIDLTHLWEAVFPR